MTEAKVQPATALPWSVRKEWNNYGNHAQIDGARLADIAGAFYLGGTDQPRQNAAYIVHTANAYPRLVAALKSATFEIKRNVGQIESEAYGNALLLLRELGELE